MADATTLDQVFRVLSLERERVSVVDPERLCDRLPEGRTRWHAGGHRCLIPPGQRGICKVRRNGHGRPGANRS